MLIQEPELMVGEELHYDFGVLVLDLMVVDRMVEMNRILMDQTEEAPHFRV